MQKYKHIVIDGNNLFWRAYSTSKGELVTSRREKFYKTGLKKAIKMTLRLEKLYGRKDCKVYVLFDNPVSAINLRKLISGGEYKHARKKVPKRFYQILTLYKEILKSIGDNYYIAFADQHEADDLTLPVFNHIKPSYENEMLLVSTDMDWARLINDYTHWLKKDDLIDKEGFIQRFGFSPDGHSIKMWKAIKGDKSDNIPNTIPYMPDQILIDIVTRYDDIGELMKGLWYDDKIPEQWKKKIHEKAPELHSSYQLVDFMPFNGNLQDIIYKCSLHVNDLRVFYGLLDMEYESFMVEEDSVDFFKESQDSLI